MSTIRLTMAQALVRYLIAQKTEVDGEEVSLFAGVMAIFGHGNVAGLGQALEEVRQTLPTYRGQNEQSMAHVATAYAKATDRRRMMACTTSIGPGATNLVTAAATAHVNRLPVLLLPGDVFVTRAPDPVLQQLECFGDPSLSVNDCLRPVSRYWDRIVRPEQLLTSLPNALRVLTDPVDCGPVTLALPQDVQTQAYDYPEAFFAPRKHRLRRPRPDPHELADAVKLLRAAKRPLIVAGGGVHYSGARDTLRTFVERTGIPVAETQAGKGALTWEHPGNVGAIGVTGSSAANALAQQADVVLGIGTRLADFTTASRSVFASDDCRLLLLNVAAFDALKHGGHPLVADARVGLEELGEALSGYHVPAGWRDLARDELARWNQAVERVCAPPQSGLPSDAQVLSAVNGVLDPSDVMVCASGGLPGELHKLWRVKRPGTYHMEYGYSCMGYEIAGGLGVKMARADRQVVVLVGDGGYLMLNSEIVTSISFDKKLIVVLLDNHGYGCISRLQKATGGAPFNNIMVGPDTKAPPSIDFAAHAAALGAHSESVTTVAELAQAVKDARQRSRTSVIVIETDPVTTTRDGGAWWDVAVPEVSQREEVRAARRAYEENKRRQKLV